MHQAVGADLDGAAEGSHKPEERHHFGDDTKRMWVGPTGFMCYPKLANDDLTMSETERRSATRHRPMSEEQMQYTRAHTLYDQKDNQASDEKKQHGAVYIPRPRERKKFNFSFGKDAKDARIQAARDTGDKSRVMDAFNQVAVVTYLEKSVKRMQELYEHMLYIHDTAQWSLRVERDQMLSLIRYIRLKNQGQELSDIVQDVLGEEVLALTDPNKTDQVDDMKSTETDTPGTAKSYGTPVGAMLAPCVTLTHALTAPKPPMEQIVKSFAPILRDEMLRMQADAQHRIQPDLPQITVDKEMEVAMPTEDKQAVAAHKKVEEMSSPKRKRQNQNTFYPKGKGGRASRGRQTGHRGRNNRQYNPQYFQQQQWQNPNQAPAPPQQQQQQFQQYQQPKGKGKAKRGRGKGRG